MKIVTGFFFDENKAKLVMDRLHAGGIRTQSVELISKYSAFDENIEPASLVDPNANIFNPDHNGLDVTLIEDVYTGADSYTNFENRLTAVLQNSATENDLQDIVKRAQESGYVIVVKTNTPHEFDVASEIMKA